MATHTENGENHSADTNNVKQGKSFYEKYSKLIIFILMLTLPIMGLGVAWSLQNMRNSMREWLPDGSPEAMRHRWFQKNFPMEQFILLSWQDCTLDDPRLDIMKTRVTPIKELVPKKDDKGKEVTDENGQPVMVEEAIREDFNLRFYEKIQTGPDVVKEMLDNYPSMTPAEALDRLNGSILGRDKENPDVYNTGMLILLKPNSEGENMRGAIGEIYRLARLPFVFDTRELTAAQVAEGKRLQEKMKGVAEEPLNFLERAAQGMAVPPKGMSAEEIEKIPEEYRLIIPGLQPEMVHMGGPPTDNIAIDVEGTRTLVRLAGLSGIVGLTIAIIFLHSFRLVYIVFSTAIFATGYSLCLVSFTGISTDAIMLSMPPLIYVLTMSSAIHVINYYHDAVAELGDTRGAPELAIKHAFYPCLVCASTTALGLLSLMTSNIMPIWKFGLYSAVGVMLAVVLYMLYLPAMLQLFPSRGFLAKVKGHKHFEKRSDIIERFWIFFGETIVRHPYITLGICIGLMTFGAMGLPQLQASVKLMKFFTPDTTIVKDYSWLEDKLGQLVPMEVLVRFDNEQNNQNMLERLRLVERVAKTSRSHKEVGGIMSVVTMTPDLAKTSTVRELALNRRLGDNYGRLREYVTFDIESAEVKYKNKHNGASPPLAEMELEKPLLEKLKGLGVTTLAELREMKKTNREDEKLTEEENELLKYAVFKWQLERCDELWRVTSRVGALTDLDYGIFVDVLKKVIDPVVEYHIKSTQLLRMTAKMAEAGNISPEDLATLEKLIQECQLEYRQNVAFAQIRAICQESKDAEPITSADMKRLDEILEHFRVEQRSDLTVPALTKLGDALAAEKKITRDEYGQWKAAVAFIRWEEGDSLKRVADLCKTGLRNLTAADRQLLEDIVNRDVISPETRSLQEVEAIYTGAVPLVYQTQHELMYSLKESIVLAFVTIAIVMMLVLRNFMGGLLAMIPNMFPIVVVFGFMGWAGIKLDIGAMMTASVALGIAVDDTIHFLTWYRRGLDAGFDNRESILLAYRRCGTAITETTFISGFGLSVFAFSTFTPTLTFGIMMLVLITMAMFGDLFFNPAILTGVGGKYFATAKGRSLLKEKQDSIKSEKAALRAQQDSLRAESNAGQSL